MVVTPWRKSAHRQSKSRRPGRSLAGRSRAHRLHVERLEPRELLDGGAIGSGYGQIPLSFEANQEQTDPAVQFLSRGSGYALFLAPTEAMLSLQRPLASSTGQPEEDVLRMQLIGGNVAAPVSGLDTQASTSNYFIGNDPARWRTNVANYAKVAYQDVYPGINLVYYGNQRQLEYDFVVGSGADPGVIRLSFQGAQNLTLDAQGNLVLQTAGGDVVEHAPVVYQEGTTGRQPVSGRYVLVGQERVGFQVGAYDASRPLIIDPILSYSTYLAGSSGGDGTGIAVDASGNAYVIGITNNINFPPRPLHSEDVFVAKLNASGTALVYSTYLGGSREDYGTGIALDASGNAYVTGYTNSSDFPTTPGVVQATLHGLDNAFVAKLNTTGTALVYSTYLGGSLFDQATSIAVDTSGNAYVTGTAGSSDFPTTSGAIQKTFEGIDSDAFVTKLNATGTALLYSTFLGHGDECHGIAVDAFGNAYVTGFISALASSSFPTTPGAVQTIAGGSHDAFVAKLNATGNVLLYATYLGGSGEDYCRGIAVDVFGNAYVIGTTTSRNFPTTPGAVQRTLRATLSGLGNAFVAKLNATGTALLYSTYLGGSGDDDGSGIAVDASGAAYVTGNTSSPNFPTTPATVQGTYRGMSDAFVAKLNATGTALVYSTYVGGSGFDESRGIAVDASGSAYITGLTYSPDFPTTPGTPPGSSASNGLVFVTKIFSQATLVTVSSSVSPSVYGQPVTFTATVTTGGNPVSTGSVTFQEGNTILLAVPLDSRGQASLQTATLTAADSPHIITAYYTSSSDTTSGSVNQTVNRAPLLVAADAKAKVYGQANPVFTAHFSGFVLGENPSVLGGTLTFSTLATVSSNVGSYAITPSGLTAANYTITFANGTLTVTPASLTVTPADVSRQLGTPNPLLTGSISGIQNGDNITASYSTPATLTSPVGTYAITATLNDPTNKLGNYNVTLNQGTLTVTPDPLLVTTTADSGPGSLRDVIATAPPGATVHFLSGLGGTITLTTGTLTITSDVTITGPGADVITVSGNHAFQILRIAPAITVTISGLTIATGLSPLFGGGISNDGTLTVSNSTVSGDEAGNRGGGIYNSPSGTLWISNSTVSGNSATNAGSGIYNVGMLDIDTSTLRNNASSRVDGGAIYNIGTLAVHRSTFSSNGGRDAFGGAVRNDGEMTLDDSMLSGNIANSGGAIYNVGALTVSNSNFSGDSALPSTSGIGGGGAIYNSLSGTLSVSSSTFSGNDSYFGVGIYNDGVLKVDSSTFSENRDSDADGGGVYNSLSGTLMVSASIFSGNTAGSGGGIWNGGALFVGYSIFSGNYSPNDGGAIYGGTLTVSRCTFSSNGAELTGAISGGRVTISDSTFSDNNSQFTIGAVSASQLTMTNCMISGNETRGSGIIFIGDGIISNSTISANNNFSSGSTILTGGTVTINNCTISGNTNSERGAIGNSGTLTISNSTISGNTGVLVGGVSNSGTLTVSNSTISGNTAYLSTPIAGGLANVAESSDATVMLLNCTIVNNTVAGGDRTGSQLYSGHDFFRPGSGNATTQLRNTILSGNGSKPNLFADTGGTFVSQGHNLSSDNSGGFQAGPGDLRNLDPMLGPLQDNGGPTQTMALLPGSPAIDAGDNTDAPDFDQRGSGFLRIVGGTIDIGAFEAQVGAATQLVVSAPPSATAGTSFDVTIRALDAYGHTASGYSGTVTFTSSDTAAGVVLPADYSFTDSDAGVHTFSGTVLLITPGDQTLTVTDTVRGISGSATVTVVPGPVPPPGSAAGGESSSQAAAVADQLFGSDHALMLARRKRDASGDDLFHEITQVDRGELVALEVGRRGLAGLFGK